MKKIALFTVFFILLLSACNKDSTQQQTGLHKILIPGCNYSLLTEPSPEADEESKEKIPGGTPVRILAIQDNWVKIEAKGRNGWIPKWFIVDKNTDGNLIKIDSDYMVLREKTEGLLYPDGPSIIGLEEGNLVKPLFSWKDWVQVSVIQFSIPSVSVTWIKKALLALTSEVEPKEGFLRVGCQAYETLDYNKINSINPTTVQFPMQVMLKEKKGEFTLVSGPSEWDAWVKSSDILYSLAD